MAHHHGDVTQRPSARPVCQTILPTCLCLCGAACFYERANTVGEDGHFHCERCGRRYSMGGG